MQAMTSNINAGDQYISTITVTDGLGRIRAVKKDASINGVAGRIVSGWTQYDGLGRVSRGHLPTTESTNDIFWRIGPPEQGTPYTEYEYDCQDRTTLVKHPDGTTTRMDYSIAADPDGILRFHTAVTDQNGHVSHVYENARKQKTAIVDALSATTVFHYDNLGQLTETIDPENHSTIHHYDSLGRRTQQTHPSSGTTTWEYDAAGNLLRQTQNDGQSISYQYDYCRPTGISYSSRPWNNVWYEYGHTGVNAGRIVKQQDATGVQEFKYDYMGNVVCNRHTYVQPHSQRTLTLTTRWGYDRWGRVDSIVYPDGERVEYHYDRGGLLHDIQGYKVGTVGNTTYIREILYNRFGQRTSIIDGDYVMTTYDYDSLTLRLAHMRDIVINSNRTLQDNHYYYDAVGNIDSIVDSGYNHRIQRYAYDSANRLVWSNGLIEPRGSADRPCYGVHYFYSPAGRLLNKTLDSWRMDASSGFHNVRYDNTYLYDNLDNPYAVLQIHNPDVPSFEFHWDGNGNLASSYSTTTQSGRT